MTDLRAAAKDWLAHDPDAETRAELQQIVDSGDEQALLQRVDGALMFGTAGIRAEVGAGPLRMNRAVIRRTTWGVARHLRDHADTPHVVVGRDARLSSQDFFDETVAVLGAMGCAVTAFPDPVPTPLVAFTARELAADAAVVITASHNPPADNGYKVYASNAVQIVPPTDADIAAAIAAAPPADRVPTSDAGWATVPADITDRYTAAVLESRLPGCEGSDLAVVYTPLHGVGGDLFEHVLAAGGHTGIRTVAAQRQPDGRFPTVAFPNPEEPGALDLALRMADETGADLVVANDPDADRLAVAVPDASGRWVKLTGNQIGLLLGDALLAAAPKGRTSLYVSSIVSTPAAGRVAAAHGARWEVTLTGFKWIWNAVLDLEASGVGTFRLGFEEALGFSVSPAVRDKDGISAGLVLVDLASQAAATGKTLLDLLDDLSLRHGMWVSRPRSLTLSGEGGARRLAAAMDAAGSYHPQRLGGMEVTGVTDYRRGGEDRPRWLPDAPLVVWDLGDRGRVVLRPSGTEPKLKVYADVVGEDVDPDQRSAAGIAAAVGDDLLSALHLTH